MNKPQHRIQHLRDALEDDIVNGRIAQGERLDEVRLSQRFAVSRTPIREALRQLAATGLVETIPRRGTFVANLGLTRTPMARATFATPAPTIRRTTPTATVSATTSTTASAEQRTRLLEKLDTCRAAAEAGNSDDYYYENEQFHGVIYELSYNRFLADQAQQLRNRLKPYRRLQLRVPQRMRSSFEEHKAIVDAILGGNEQNAELLLKNHVLIQGERFADLVSMINAAPKHETVAESATA